MKSSLTARAPIPESFSVKIGTILLSLQRYAGVYVFLAAVFLFCGLSHYFALVRMEECHRQFAVMTDRILYAMALIDLVAANSWLAPAYAVLVVAAVGFSQFRRHPAWSYWLTAAIFSVPCLLYSWKCIYIAGIFRLF